MARAEHAARSSGPAKRGVYHLFRDTRHHEMFGICTASSTPFKLTKRWVTMGLKRELEYARNCRIVGIRADDGTVIGRHDSFELYATGPSAEFTVDWIEF